ncbi:MAG: hypothetical protein QW328_09760 [Nitrososphaerota archaeon]
MKIAQLPSDVKTKRASFLLFLAEVLGFVEILFIYEAKNPCYRL